MRDVGLALQGNAFKNVRFFAGLGFGVPMFKAEKY
jgi:hypothetical protein